ncbi:lipoprotein [Salmonella enterica subsp. enterica]|nr:lipoprotein [Salmonella enterica subsp. enterica]
MKKTLETMLTPQKGRFWLSASTGTLTVTDTPLRAQQYRGVC